MIAWKPFDIDLNKPRRNVLHLNQGDTVRQVTVKLYLDGNAFDVVAQSTSALEMGVRYIKANGVSGYYSETTDGDIAVWGNDEPPTNVYYAKIDEHVTDVPGFAKVFIQFSDANRQVLYSFPIDVEVGRTNGSTTDPGQSYYNSGSFILSGAQSSKTASMTQAVGIDANGKLWTKPGNDSGGVETATTPQEYGAYGDGVHDDALAIQAAIATGEPVVFPAGVYYIETPVHVEDVDGISVDFGNAKIHVKSSATDKTGFWFENCNHMVLRNLTMYSELDQDINVPSGHTVVRETASNILGVCIQDCEDVTAINSTFDKLNADFWLKTKNNQILIDGWKTTDCCMPMYSERATNMRVTNFDHTPLTGLGNGHHSFYLYGKHDNITIDNGRMNAADNNYGALITTHYSTSSDTEIGKNIFIRDCSIEYGHSACYIANNGYLNFERCRIFPYNASVNRLGNGEGHFSFSDCEIGITSHGIQATSNETGAVLFDSCKVSGSAVDAYMTERIKDVSVLNCDITGAAIANQGGTGTSLTFRNSIIRCGSLTLTALYRNTSTATSVEIETITAYGNGSVANVYYRSDQDSKGFKIHNSRFYDFTRIYAKMEEGEISDLWLNGNEYKFQYLDINRVPISIDTNGQIFNSIGYIDGYRFDSNGNLTAMSGSMSTGYIPFKTGDLLEFSNMAWDSYSTNGGKYCYIIACHKEFTKIGSYNNAGSKSGNLSTETSVVKDGNKYTVRIKATDELTAYIRVSALWDSSMGTPTIKRYVDPDANKGAKGDKGDPGDDYVLTNQDKEDIAQIAVGLLPVYSGGVS